MTDVSCVTRSSVGPLLSLVPPSDEDTMAIVSDATTLPSIVRLMSDPTQSKEVMAGCFSALNEISSTDGAVAAVAGTEAVALAIRYLDDNAYELPKEVRACCVGVYRRWCVFACARSNVLVDTNCIFIVVDWNV